MYNNRFRLWFASLSRSNLIRYEYSTIGAIKGRYGVAIVRLTEQAESEAQSVARDVIQDLAPKWLILCGIAGGVPSHDFCLGDVLIASRIHDFSVCAALEDHVAEYQQMGGPMQHEVNRILGALPGWEDRLGNWNSNKSIGYQKPELLVPRSIKAKSFYGDLDWRRRVRESLNQHFPSDGLIRQPLYHIAPTGSSNTLVKDTKTLKHWLKSARHLTHVEMEAAGIYRVASQFNLPLLCVRGISDIVGYKRSAKWTEYACHSAASFIHALICQGPELSSDYRGISSTPNVNFWRQLPEHHYAVDLLNWRYRLTKPYGREDELKELHSWAQLDHPLRVRILCGPGGAGKTRLAAELCTELINKGWGAEFVPRGEELGENLDGYFSVISRKVLYVFDYPEERPEQLVKFLIKLERVSNTPYCPIRVLLLSRQNLNWWQTRTSLKSASLNHLFDSVEIEIGRIKSDNDVLKIFRETCQCLCNKYKFSIPSVVSCK